MSAPMVVNLKDGSVWTRRGALRAGEALYALAGVCDCPEFVMATQAELAECGIAGTAEVLPVPVSTDPKPQPMTPERLVAVAALAAAATPGPWWTETLAEHDGSTSVGIDAGGDNWVVPCQDLDAADAEFIAHARTDVPALLARVAELEKERHSTNEALSKAMEALRPPVIVYRAEHPDSGIVLGTYSNREAAVAHCEALATREGATGLVSWVPDNGDAFSPEELTYFDVEYCDGDDVPCQTCTGYIVTPIEVASEYDAEADE
ncbi:hypothetical protein ACWERY_15950 [Streptomyces sp. NPDC004082]